MSFGWSAGGIATATKLIYNLIQALDSCDGAAGNYREAVGFLRDLNRTLDPLHTFAVLNAHPSYAKEIEEQVSQIKEPVEKFLEAVVEFELALGKKAAAGHHRHVFRKLRWHALVSKKVLVLRRSIESRMRVIDTLLQRLTLDIVTTIKTQLPQDLRTVFEDTLRPDLISLLQENLLPLNEQALASMKEIQEAHHERLSRRTLEHYHTLSSDIRWIKEHIDKPSLIQEQIGSALSETNCRRKVLSAEVAKADSSENGESLQDIYYLIFLCFGLFLKNFLRVLSRLFQPSQALTSSLLAKYNISLLDALGRAPRVLPYDFFQSLEVLQAFIRQEFRHLPGSSWVERGDYHLFSSLGDLRLTSRNWKYLLIPGTTVTMSIVIHYSADSIWDKEIFKCPQASCPGKLQFSGASHCATCSMCQKEVIHYLEYSNFFDGSENAADRTEAKDLTASTRLLDQNQSGEKPRVRVKDNSYRPPLEDEIAVFKRITQSRKSSNLSNLEVARVLISMQQSAKLTASEKAQKSGSESPLTSVAVAPSLPGTTNEEFDYDLPCEFGLLGCDLSFQLGEVDAWISHSTSHFRKVGPPLKCECTFCDKLFENCEDPSASWRERMIHVARHSQEIGDNPRDMIIPHDIFVAEHLYRNGLMSQEEYDWVIGQTGNSRLDGIADLSEQTLQCQTSSQHRQNTAMVKKGQRG